MATQDDTILGDEGDDTISGGTGDDVLTGGDGNDTFIYTPGDGLDTITDFNAGNTGGLWDGDGTNNDFIDLSGYYDNLAVLYADQADDGILNQSNTLDSLGNAVDYSGNTQFGAGEGIVFQGANADGTSFSFGNTGVVCFTSGTAIRTPRGDVLIDDLKTGDLVTTMDNGPQRIKWIGTTFVGPEKLAACPNMRPIHIKRGVLGATRDLLVSPQHGMLIGGTHLARATHLANTTKGVRVAHGRKSVTYVHLMFETHQIIFAENAPSESFYPGPMALRMMDSQARRDVVSLYPALACARDLDMVAAVYGPTARKFAQKRDVQRIQDRHKINAAPVQPLKLDAPVASKADIRLPKFALPPVFASTAPKTTHLGL